MQEPRFEQQVSEDRWGDREWTTYIGMSQKRETGRERNGNSRDLSNRSLKSDRERERRTYIGIDIRKTCLKTDGETESRNPT